MQTTNFTEEVEHTVGLSIDCLQIRTEVDLETCELVKSARLFRCRVKAPGADLGFQNFKIIEFSVLGEA